MLRFAHRVVGRRPLEIQAKYLLLPAGAGFEEARGVLKSAPISAFALFTYVALAAALHQADRVHVNDEAAAGNLGRSGEGESSAQCLVQGRPILCFDNQVEAVNAFDL